MARPDGRSPEQLRPIVLERGATAAVTARPTEGEPKEEPHLTVSLGEVVGGFGPRAGAVRQLRDHLAGVVENTNVDTLPEQLMNRVCALMRNQGITRTRMAALRCYKNINIDHAPSRRLEHREPARHRTRLPLRGRLHPRLHPHHRSDPRSRPPCTAPTDRAAQSMSARTSAHALHTSVAAGTATSTAWNGLSRPSTHPGP